MKKSPCLFITAILIHSYILSQVQTFTGRIIEPDGKPVPFATINAKGSVNSVISDEQGRFNIKTQTNDTLIISAVNFQMQRFVVGSAPNFTITLIRTETALTPVMNRDKDTIHGSLTPNNSSQV